METALVESLTKTNEEVESPDGPKLPVRLSVPPRRNPLTHLSLAGIDPLRLQSQLTVVALPAVPLVRDPLQALGAAPPASRDVSVIEPAGNLLPVAPAKVLLVEGSIVVTAVILAAEWPRAHRIVVLLREGRGSTRGGGSSRNTLAALTATVVTEVRFDGLLVNVLYVPVEIGGSPKRFLAAAYV